MYNNVDVIVVNVRHQHAVLADQNRSPLTIHSREILFQPGNMPIKKASRWNKSACASVNRVAKGLLVKLRETRMITKVSLALGLVLVASSALAGPAMTVRAPMGKSFHPVVTVTKLVSDQQGVAANTDPNLVNSWGISHGDTGLLWVADNGTDLATVYDPNTGMPQSLVVNIPMGAPTGNVFVPSGIDFQISENGNSGPATFLFDTESGAIEGWNANVDMNNAVVAVDNSANGAVYKGLALDTATQRLFAANFTQNQVEVYDTGFNLINTFTDTTLPQGWAPFNVVDINGTIYVAFAKQGKVCCDEVDRPHLGYVDVFNADGQMQKRLISKGELDAPWGMTIAPAGFGSLAGDLLVGNFGDGRIHAYDPNTGAFIATLRTGNGRILKIDELWGLINGPNDNQVTFAAGPGDESHGLVGLLAPQ
jgi:uncharacterized protein (TIGR03118 family)